VEEVRGGGGEGWRGNVWCGEVWRRHGKEEVTCGDG